MSHQIVLQQTRSIMKTLCFIISLIIFTFSVQAQNEEFNVTEEIQLLKQDIADLENEIKEVEDPEEKANLEKELATVRRSLNMLEKNKFSLSAPEVKKAQQNEFYIFQVPEYDKSRIEKIPSDIKDNAQLESQLHTIAMKVERIVPEKIKSVGLQLSIALKNPKTDTLSKAALAVGIWMLGDPYLALYLQNLACQEDPLRVEWLSNFASMLTMMGGEEYALPILHLIDYFFPNNSVTLNNIGMAWYGLGDLKKAEHYLDSSIILPGNHSQALMAKALIEEKKGNNQKAAELVKKSLGEGYSQDKENHLRKMGIEPDGSYIQGTDEIKEEYLGLQQFINLIPPYPKSAYDLEKAYMEWSSFKEKLSAKHTELEQQIEAFEPIHKAALENFQKGQMELRLKFSPIALKYLAKNQNTLIRPTMEDLQIKTQRIVDEYKPDFNEMQAKRQRLGEYLNTDISNEEECRAISEYISFANDVWENYNNSGIRFWKRTFNTMAQYQKYYLTPTPESYQLIIMGLQKDFIGSLMGLNYEFWTGISCIEQPPIPQQMGPLPLFEDVHCDKQSELWLPGLCTIITNCHYMETNFDIWTPLPIELKMKLKDDLLTGQHVGGSLTVGTSQSIIPKVLPGKIADQLKINVTPYTNYFENPSPDKIDLKMSESVTFEWDSQGITDVSVSVGLKGQYGLNIKDIDGSKMEGVKSVTVLGIKQNLSLLSGASTKFKNSWD